MPIARALVAIIFMLSSYAMAADVCTYQTWVWNPAKNSAVGHTKIKKSKKDLSPEEIGTLEGCSVCDEDQIELKLNSLPPFKVCKILQGRIERALKKALSDGFPLASITGYRVGKSKGPINKLGERTEFSNHSFGTAIDFNAEQNGLYDFCPRFSPACKLLRGGDYRPGTPGSITKESSLYKAFLAEGFKWGGELEGKQKDFMHFSLTGS